MFAIVGVLAVVVGLGLVTLDNNDTKQSQEVKTHEIQKT